jgi:cobalt-zinc-cadmium efflux system outer membrane protein
MPLNRVSLRSARVPPLHWALFLALIAAASSASAAPPPVPNIPSRLTLEDALRIFRAHGLDLVIAEAAVAGAEADVRTAGAIPNPTVGVSYSHTFTYRANDPSCSDGSVNCTPDGFGLNASENAAIMDSVSGKRLLRLKVARTALAAAKQTRLDAQRNLEFQVKQQYTQAVLAKDQLDFATEVQKKATQVFELNQVRYRSGAISEADVAKVEAAKLEADQAVASARLALLTAKAGLAFLLGVRGGWPAFEVDPDLPKYAVPTRLMAPTADALLELAVEHRPDLRGQRLQRDRAQASISLARRLRVPDIALGLAYQQTGTGGAGTNAPLTPPTLTVGLTIPLPVLYQQQGEIRRAEVDYMVQDAQRNKLEAQLVNDVSSALAAFTTSRELVERMQARLLDRVARARDLVGIQYQKGAASLLEFLDAERTYIATNQEYLQDLANYWIALYEVEQAIGMDLRD